MNARWFHVLAVALLLAGCASAPVVPSAEEKQALAPTGKLRLAFLANTAMHATQDPASGELRGPAIDVGKEMARRLGVPFQPVTYRTVAETVASAGKGEWDAIAIGINPDRLKIMDFSAPYSQIEIGILAAPAARISAVDDIDKPGIRIAVLQRGDSDILLTQSLKRATLVRTQTIGESLEMVKSGKADATSALKTFLIPAAEQFPGSRIVPGRLAVQEIAIAVPKGGDVSVRYIRRLINELKSEGFVKASIERAAVRGLMPAP